MLFITSRVPRQSTRFRKNRPISFDYQNTDVSCNLYFCRRNDKEDYIEVGSQAFFAELKSLPSHVQVLFYIHGFNSLQEKAAFPQTTRLQSRLNETRHGELVKVVPIIWPCDDDHPAAIIDDYWDDQKASKASGKMFSRLLGKFDDWRRQEAQLDDPCRRRINLLAHSMGNNVLQHAFLEWYEEHGPVPQLFRNIFMVGADVVNHTLETGQTGEHIADATRNLVVYFANDDLAMPASKVANIKQKTLSRRLGMTGPESLERAPRNVIEVDCDDFNNSLDFPDGHTYFIESKDQKIVSPCVEHFADAIKTGRVTHVERRHKLDRPIGL
ncbi:alpha/beta hydrolase [Aestuariibacter salexigens]|uniref:alpha/beta hydrolase n=1 Tax=Aestuariibacter salexigens TaxID=226010 RepID=UPI000400520F|nr:alpha/beta hydrolase [Aestuariibacter salexigens]